MFSIAAEVRNTLGECPLWCERTHRLLCTNLTRLAFYNLNSRLISPIAASPGDTGTKLTHL